MRLYNDLILYLEGHILFPMIAHVDVNVNENTTSKAEIKDRTPKIKPTISVRNEEKKSNFKVGLCSFL